MRRKEKPGYTASPLQSTATLPLFGLTVWLAPSRFSETQVLWKGSLVHDEAFDMPPMSRYA